MATLLLSSLSRQATPVLARRLGGCTGTFTRQLAARTFVSRTSPLMDDDLPYHIVMGMPALSPTMESGVLAEWYVKEGDSFIAGESLAKIETDKASIDFEAQDDGYVAKLLVDGSNDDIPVGKPIMVTVEEEEDIAAFADYTPPEEAAAPAAPAKEEASAPPPPPPKEAAPAPKEEAPAAAAPPPPPAGPATTPPPPPPAASPAPPAANAAIAPGWGSFAKDSPLAKTLSKQQTMYIEKYGTTGQIPL